MLDARDVTFKFKRAIVKIWLAKRKIKMQTRIFSFFFI